MRRRPRGVVFSTKKPKPEDPLVCPSNYSLVPVNQWSLVPRAALIRIFEFLRTLDLVDCVYVCKKWAKIIDVEERWKGLFLWQNNKTILVNDSWGQLPPDRWRMKCTIRKRALRIVADGLCERINKAFLEKEFEYPIENWKETELLHRDCLRMARKWGYDETNRITEYWYLNQKMSYTGFVCGIYAEVSVNKFGKTKVFLDTGKGKMGIGDVSLSFVNEITYKMNDLTL